MNVVVPAYDCEAEGIQFDVAVTRVLGLVAEKVGVEEVPLIACAAASSPRPGRHDWGFHASTNPRWTVMLFAAPTCGQVPGWPSLAAQRLVRFQGAFTQIAHTAS